MVPTDSKRLGAPAPRIRVSNLGGGGEHCLFCSVSLLYRFVPLSVFCVLSNKTLNFDTFDWERLSELMTPFAGTPASAVLLTETMEVGIIDFSHTHIPATGRPGLMNTFRFYRGG